jgi:uncharacterized paraquat-inducible protein A
VGLKEVKATFAVVRCPSCGFARIVVYGTRRARCYRCEMAYTTNPKTAYSRIIFHSESIEKCKMFLRSFSPKPLLKQASLLEYSEDDG